MRFTASSIENPFVHFIRVPDDIDVCLTGKENVKPNSLCLPGKGWEFSSSAATNFASSAAIKSNNSYKKIAKPACEPIQADQKVDLI